MKNIEGEWLTEHTVESGSYQLNYYIRRPAGGPAIGPAWLLISTGGDWQTSLFSEPYRLTADAFVANGHFALSFDTPCHGQRTEPYGEQIEGFRHALSHGDDPFERFVGDAAVVIDDCIRQGIVSPGNIAVCGASRGGYMAFRLLAADPRISRAAGFAPVTDWRCLREFEEIRDTEPVRSLRLHQYIDRLAGKPVFLAIGNRDTRVSTLSCCKLYTELTERNTAQGFAEAMVEFYVTDDPAHTMGNAWYEKGVRFLLEGASVSECEAGSQDRGRLSC